MCAVSHGPLHINKLRKNFGKQTKKRASLLSHVIRHIDYSHTKFRHIDWGWCRQFDRIFFIRQMDIGPFLFPINKMV